MKFEMKDYLILGILLLLAVLPDPLDLFDFGTPLIEALVMGIYLIFKKKRG